MWDLVNGLVFAQIASEQANSRAELLRAFPEQAASMRQQWAQEEQAATAERRHRELVRAQEEIARSIRWAAIFK